MSEKPRLLPSFMVNINAPVESGRVQVIARLAQPDVNTINAAADAMKLRQSDYLRVVLVRVSERILYEIYGSAGAPRAQ